jgi:hypothetical protein
MVTVMDDDGDDDDEVLWCLPMICIILKAGLLFDHICPNEFRVMCLMNIGFAK